MDDLGGFDLAVSRLRGHLGTAARHLEPVILSPPRRAPSPLPAAPVREISELLLPFLPALSVDLAVLALATPHDRVLAWDPAVSLLAAQGRRS